MQAGIELAIERRTLAHFLPSLLQVTGFSFPSKTSYIPVRMINICVPTTVHARLRLLFSLHNRSSLIS